MSIQKNPLDGYKDMQSSVTEITQPSKSQEHLLSTETADSKVPWQHFSMICAVDIVSKIKAISHNEGFTVRSVIEKFLTDGIARYELKHGPITEQQRNINEVL